MEHGKTLNTPIPHPDSPNYSPTKLRGTQLCSSGPSQSLIFVSGRLDLPLDWKQFMLGPRMKASLSIPLEATLFCIDPPAWELRVSLFSKCPFSLAKTALAPTPSQACTARALHAPHSALLGFATRLQYQHRSCPLLAPHTRTGREPRALLGVVV